MRNTVVEKIDRIFNLINPVVTKIGDIPIIEVTKEEKEIYQTLVRLRLVLYAVNEEYKMEVGYGIK